jgi:hypothetical protein
MWKLLDARRAEYPAEHNVGHLYNRVYGGFYFPSRPAVALPTHGHYDVKQYQAPQYLQLHYGIFCSAPVRRLFRMQRRRRAKGLLTPFCDCRSCNSGVRRPFALLLRCIRNNRLTGALQNILLKTAQSVLLQELQFVIAIRTVVKLKILWRLILLYVVMTVSG